MDNRKVTTNKIDDTRIKLITKLLPHLRKYGIVSLSMEEIAKIAEVSRATLYKYFSSKEEIISFTISGFVEYMNGFVVSPSKSDQEFVSQFQQMFEHSVSLAVYFSDVFVKDIETHFPESHDQLSAAMKNRENQILEYYEAGKRRNIFNNINGLLLILQDNILKTILNAKFLLQTRLSTERILSDYYELKKIQLIRSEKYGLIDDSAMLPRIEHLAEKINKNIINSVRE